MRTFYHMRHVCGHSVYWSLMSARWMFACHPCPWCAGPAARSDPYGHVLSGTPLPKKKTKFFQVSNGIWAFRKLSWWGRVPWPPHLAFLRDEPVTLSHMPGDCGCPEAGSYNNVNMASRAQRMVTAAIGLPLTTLMVLWIASFFSWNFWVEWIAIWFGGWLLFDVVRAAWRGRVGQ